jgi:hypothetical protein
MTPTAPMQATLTVKPEQNWHLDAIQWHVMVDLVAAGQPGSVLSRNSCIAVEQRK